MFISTTIRGLHVYEKESGKIQAGDLLHLAVDRSWKEVHGVFSVKVFNASGNLCGHLAAEDAAEVGKLLETGSSMKAQVPADARRRGGRMGKEIDVLIEYW